jgi:hypothetical protein
MMAAVPRKKANGERDMRSFRSGTSHDIRVAFSF